MHNIVQKLFN